MLLIGSAQAKFNRIAASLDVERYCILHHETLPGGSRPIGDFEMVSHGEEWWKLTQLPGVKRFSGFVSDDPEWLNSPIKKMDDDFQRRGMAYADALAKHSTRRARTVRCAAGKEKEEGDLRF